MFTKKQISTIIKVLKDSCIGERPALRQVFEQGGFLWATNGYVAFELAEVKDEFKDKAITLEKLQAWNATHKASETTLLTELATDNEYSAPAMTTLLHQEYKEAKDFKFNIDFLKLATDFLGVKLFTVEVSTTNPSCFRIKPLETMHVAHEAMEIKAYVMGLGR